VGILPGIGGSATLAIMLPFIYRMTPQEGIPFLLGMHSVVQTTGDITSVLFGIPGEPTTVATIMDGYPMAKKGEAGRALGAALMSSLVGAIIGAIVLVVAIPLVKPLILACGSPEMLMVIIIGLTSIAGLSSKDGRGLTAGLLAGGFGLLCAMVGEAPQTGTLRLTFGQMALWNGIPLVPAIIGIFTIPEIVDLKVRGTSIAGNLSPEKLSSGVMEGIRDTFRHGWLVIRCSLIGSWIGFLPGLGGAVSQWIAYGHAVQSSRTKEERAGFGKGDVRGVLGPGAANNSKEGAGLIPTIAFGIPATGSMSILLSGLIILGLAPGPDMLTKHLALTFSMAWTIALANIITVAVSLLFINHFARLTLIRGNLLIPVIVFLCFLGAYGTENRMGDLLVMVAFGFLGYWMLRAGLPRPPFIIGLLLGEPAETYLALSTQLYGFNWLFRPGVVILMLLAVAVVLYPMLSGWRMQKVPHGK
ncbi:MAG: hypothetical protein A2521_01385, partial [Deltaproteobacteria bacterium RIFOXYD12_FULL_57_12]